MAPGDVARALLAIAATMTDLPDIGMDHLTIRSPSPAAASFLDLLVLLTALVRARRASPGDDVLTMLMDTPVEEDGSQRLLTDDELAGRLLELAFAGHETVAKLIPNGVVALAWFPDARRELAGDPALMPNAVKASTQTPTPSTSIATSTGT